jgi:hypothetical protein
MQRARRALASLALVALVGCGQVTPAGTAQTSRQAAVAEPTLTPTIAQQLSPTIEPTAPSAPTRIPPTVAPQTTATVAMHANGRIPAGWRIYVGTSVPVVFNHHSDWGIQRQKVHDDFIIVAAAPDQRSIFAVGPHDDLTESLPALLELSDAEIEETFLADQLADGGGMFAGFCDGAVTAEGITRTPIEASDFLTFDVRCAMQRTPSRLRILLGMVEGRAWIVLTAAPQSGYAEIEQTYLGPMLASLRFD